MKKLSTLLALTLTSAFTFAQCDGRYQTEIFSSVTVTEVNYSDVYTDNEHKMDIYTANGDTAINRPVVLYMHGGSFTAGDKTTSDCVDFCESMAKRGYVAASLNYRLSDFSFLFSNEIQYETVLKAVSDAKSAIRYFRKDFAAVNTYGIDPNTIFVGGYSAGAVIAVHLAYIDSISDLPTTPINVQTIVNNVGGINGLEGDAGNYGYSSDVNGVISFAGGINDVNWIDANDEPLVTVQGTDDLTVNYNCGPGQNIASVLTLCGSAEMHPQADLVGVLNDKLIFPGEGHNWGATGNINSKFIQAVDFTSDFLYPLLPCNNTTSISEGNTSNKQLIRITDMLGRNVSATTNATLFYIYDDGSVEKKMILK
jgi:hypothetical protein